MNMQAAVSRKVHEPLAIESFEFDKPWGREVLVCAAAMPGRIHLQPK